MMAPSFLLRPVDPLFCAFQRLPRPRYRLESLPQTKEFSSPPIVFALVPNNATPMSLRNCDTIDSEAVGEGVEEFLRKKAAEFFPEVDVIVLYS
eukprot:scaffold1901_cov236-Pinguiococcus_pyrenoidosus.AAC.2